eukprot:305804_1
MGTVVGIIIGVLFVIGFSLTTCACMCRRGDINHVGWAPDRYAANAINNNKNDNKSNKPSGQQIEHPIQIKLQTDLNAQQTITSKQEGIPNDTPQSQVEELPAGWMTCETDDGEIYYQNNITEKTQWEKPIV